MSNWNLSFKAAAPLPLPERDVRHYGPMIDSRILFYEQAVNIYNDTGVDVFAGQSTYDLNLPKHDWEVRPRSKPVDDIKHGASKGGTAEALQISERTVFNLLASGQLPSVKIGGSRRIFTDDLKALARSGAEIQRAE
ncbi:MAG TPA: helix-turn-helix domain-containing protein [Terracidiphilus sp.]